MSKKPFDDAFKDLAEQDAEVLLRLLDAIPPGATVTPLPREVSVQALLPDQPYEISVAGRKHIAHLEAQTYYESDLPHRIADYDVRLWLKYRLPVYTYVLVFVPTGMPKDAPTSINIDLMRRTDMVIPNSSSFPRLHAWRRGRTDSRSGSSGANLLRVGSDSRRAGFATEAGRPRRRPISDTRIVKQR